MRTQKIEEHRIFLHRGFCIIDTFRNETCYKCSIQKTTLFNGKNVQWEVFYSKDIKMRKSNYFDSNNVKTAWYSSNRIINLVRYFTTKEEN